MSLGAGDIICNSKITHKCTNKNSEQGITVFHLTVSL